MQLRAGTGSTGYLLHTIRPFSLRDCELLELLGTNESWLTNCMARGLPVKITKDGLRFFFGQVCAWLRVEALKQPIKHKRWARRFAKKNYYTPRGSFRQGVLKAEIEKIFKEEERHFSG